MDNRNAIDESDHLPRQDAVEALGEGARGAFVVSLVGVGLLLIGWLLFYFLIFMRRGHIG